MGPGQNFLTQVDSIFCCSGRVSYLRFGFGKFPHKFSKFFPSDQKKFIWVKKYLVQRRVGL